MTLMFKRFGAPGVVGRADRFASRAPWDGGPAILALSALLWGGIYLLTMSLLG